MERPEGGSFVTIPKAARRSGLGLRQFRRAIETGELPVYDVGGWPRLRWDEVERWLDGKRRPVAKQSEPMTSQKSVDQEA